jgi:hypothetical protein
MYFRRASQHEAKQDMERFGFKGGWSLHGLTSYLKHHPAMPIGLFDVCSDVK